MLQCGRKIEKLGILMVLEIFRGFGKGIREFKEASKEIQKEIESDDSKDKK